MLVVKHPVAASYKITWGATSKIYTAEQLAKGINLAADFETNPFSEPFAKVDAAIAAKQNFETRQVKTVFHGEQGRNDMDAAVKSTEEERAKLVKAVAEAFAPVQHAIQIEPQ